MSARPGGGRLDLHQRRRDAVGLAGFGSGDAEIIGVLLAAPLAAVGLDGFCVGLCVTGEPDHRRGGGCALDGGRQAVHLCPAGRDDLGGGLGFDGLGGGLLRLGFVQLGQLVFQLVDLVGGAVQIAAQLRQL